MTTGFLLFLCRRGTLERLSFTVHEKRQFDGQKQIFRHPSTERGGFVDGGQILKVPSTERGGFVDGGQILRVPSTKLRVFVDGTKIFGRRGLTDRIK